MLELKYINFIEVLLFIYLIEVLFIEVLLFIEIFYIFFYSFE